MGIPTLSRCSTTTFVMECSFVVIIFVTSKPRWFQAKLFVWNCCKRTWGCDIHVDFSTFMINWNRNVQVVYHELVGLIKFSIFLTLGAFPKFGRSFTSRSLRYCFTTHTIIFLMNMKEMETTTPCLIVEANQVSKNNTFNSRMETMC